MAKIKEVQTDHSPEVHELIGFIPSWIVRFGILLIFIILLFLLTISCFVKSPEIIIAPLILTTSNSPAPLVAKTSGRILLMSAIEGQAVTAGQQIALLESEIPAEDINAISTILSKVGKNWESEVLTILLPESLTLGEMQMNYVKFQSSFIAFKSYLENAPLRKEIKVQTDLIRLKKDYLSTIKEQQKIRHERFKISETLFQQDSFAYVANKYGILKREFDLSHQGYLQEKEELIAFDASVKALDSEIIQMQKTLNDAELNQIEAVQNFKTSLNEYNQLMKTQISSWRESHVVLSPINGNVTFTKFWSANQFINQGDRIAVVIPATPTIFGRASIPTSAIGLIEVGQHVNIKLTGFPHMNYGVLVGTVRAVSLIPENNSYLAEINLDSGMMSSYREHLKFVHEMDGVAEIATKERRLIHRIIPTITNGH